MRKNWWITGWLLIALMAPAVMRGETVKLAAGTPLHVQLETTLSTKTSKPGEAFRARIVYAVFADEREAIPVGSMVEGTIVNLKAPGRTSGEPQIQLRPDSIVFPDGSRAQLTASVTETSGGGDKVEVDSEEGTISSSGKDGVSKGKLATNAATAATLGAIYTGSAEGALIGAGAVGAITLFHYLFKRGKDLEIPAGSELVMELNREFTYTALEDENPIEPRKKRDPDARPRLSR
ncbi:MAG: hypothetical protein A3F68_06495 [Acidobacteria bacterium RIFCSPLOWO2_12_FULL_54_10]|nr:MAG: hypothetical protein A3F68_06495 [Acidobacteria bacterium RIFCSPLOWO2_12_FULL_54_10]